MFPNERRVETELLFHGDMPIKSYRDLEAWQLAMSLVEAVYQLTEKFPSQERFGLTTQLRRAAVGIPSHVAEGHQYGTRAYRHYVVIALGSQAECETQLELAERLKLAPRDAITPVREAAARVGQVLHGLVRSLPQNRHEE
jgi:four helix bundle protein